tara:strand:+ start:14728 stop:15240 length:513 start_codon:yes stop_codon:yes gene_type:complete
MTDHPDSKARKDQLQYQQIVKAVLSSNPIKYIKVKQLSEDARLPTKANESDAGFDLYASEDTQIPSGERVMVSTSISLAIHDGWVGLIWPRSGMAVKQGVDVFAGVIDAGYRGEVKVCLYNSGKDTVEIKTGDRIAQLLIQKLANTTLAWTHGELDDTGRGEGGFGSSGK